MHAIKAQHLVRKFGDFAAVGGVEFEVHQGEVFGFLGPNSAGKWTTINMNCFITHVSRTAVALGKVTGYWGTSAFESASITRIMPIWSTHFRHNRHPHTHEDSAGASSAC